ncbi:unnamed protein product [Calypogeia fissa]
MNPVCGTNKLWEKPDSFSDSGQKGNKLQFLQQLWEMEDEIIEEQEFLEEDARFWEQDLQGEAELQLLSSLFNEGFRLLEQIVTGFFCDLLPFWSLLMVNFLIHDHPPL